MKQHARRVLYILAAVLSLVLLAAPARGAEWIGVQVGGGGLSISFGATNWAVYGSSWSSPNWQMDYHVALSGYGDWVWVDGLGQCWRPWVSVGWRPYTHGRWVATPYGWTWVAYEPWGYFPHHYGHWAMSYHGWVWSPGYTYRPANVTWVTSGGYVGWYACPPPGWSHAARGYRHGYGHGYQQGHHDGYGMGYNDGYWSGWNDARYATYSEWRHLGAEDLSRHAVTASTVRASAAGAQPRVSVAAPETSVLARRGVTLPQMAIETRTIKVDDRAVTIARPSGIEASIRRHGTHTVERALTPEGQTTVSERSARSAPSTLPSQDRRVNIARDHDPAHSRARTNRELSSQKIIRPSNSVSRSHTTPNIQRSTRPSSSQESVGQARLGGPQSTGTSDPRHTYVRSPGQASGVPATTRRSVPMATTGDAIQPGHGPTRGEKPQTRRERSEVTSRERLTAVRTPTGSTEPRVSETDEAKSAQSSKDRTVSQHTSQEGKTARKTSRRR